MNVIPVINCLDIEGVKKRLETAKTFLHEGDIMHLDVADGTFDAPKNWSDPLAWVTLKSPFAIEVHLMVAHPEEHVDNWLAAGVRRLIIHIETVTQESLHEIVSAAERYRVEVMLSLRPDSSIDEIIPHLKHFTAFQILAVQPGAEGQLFLPFIKDKVGLLREEAPDVTIEVDGGMNPETALVVKSVGADTIVSSSYIFESADPKAAYEALKNS
jgi:ribulose-phosphate 3-epimerase